MVHCVLIMLFRGISDDFFTIISVLFAGGVNVGRAQCQGLILTAKLFITADADVESVSSEQSSHDAKRSRDTSSIGESDSASPGPDHTVVKTQLPAGKVSIF